MCIPELSIRRYEYNRSTHQLPNRFNFFDFINIHQALMLRMKYVFPVLVQCRFRPESFNIDRIFHEVWIFSLWLWYMYLLRSTSCYECDRACYYKFDKGVFTICIENWFANLNIFYGVKFKNELLLILNFYKNYMYKFSIFVLVF